MEISKWAVLFAKEHQRDQKKVTNDFRINFRYVFVHAKMTLPIEYQKMYLHGGFNQNDSLSIS